MDRKSLVILVVAVLLMVVGWPALVNKIYPPIPAPAKTNSVTLGTNTISGTNSVASIAPTSTNLISTTSASTNALIGKEENITITNAQAIYHFSSIHGGIKLIELRNYPTLVGCKADKALTNPPARLNHRASLPLFSIAGAPSLMEDNVYRLSSTGSVVRAEKALANGLVIIKEFEILTNYQVNVTVRWENHGAAPFVTPQREIIFGSSTPMGAHEELRTLGVDWFNGSKAIRTDRTHFEPSSFLGIWNSPGKGDYVGGESNVLWAAAHNQFFTVVATPSVTAEKIVAHPVDLPPINPEELKDDPRAPTKPVGIMGAFVHSSVTIPAQASFVEKFQVYAGPKEYQTLSLLTKFADFIMNIDGFWGWFAKVLLLSMNGLYSLGISYGWAIIVITVILKILFYPLTAASTRSMKRMSALQPQMKAIQDKYKDDPTKMNQKLQEFMKEHKINPLGSCLPLLLTIPVFAGFWKMLYSAIELRGAGYLWACDLSQPDTVAVLLGVPINGFALLMIGTMMWQSHMTPPSPGIDPAQQKMMRYMPLIIVPFIYNQAAGLTLYWSVQNLLSILQMKLTSAKEEPTTPAAPGKGAPAPAKPIAPKSRKP